MAQNSKPHNVDGVEGRRSRGSRKPKQAAGRGKRIRVEPVRRERIDPDMIALCYWLIAQRIVEEAGAGADAAALTKASRESKGGVDTEKAPAEDAS
jgi:hypothetical protein